MHILEAEQLSFDMSIDNCMQGWCSDRRNWNESVIEQFLVSNFVVMVYIDTHQMCAFCYQGFELFGVLKSQSKDVF